MKDKYGRQVDYLRISITDRCNLRCQYCMPPDGVEFKSHGEIMRYEEIINIVEAGQKLGIKKVRITGGEPLVRKGIVDFISQLNELNLNEISITTNGLLLNKYAADLKKAGLSRVNISLDSLQPERYRKITRRDEFERAMKGIKTALQVGLEPVKINTVVMKGINDDELEDFIDLSYREKLHIRFIEYMPLGDTEIKSGDYYISLSEYKDELISKKGIVPATIKNNGPAEYYKIPGAKGTVGFITAISHTFCDKCNRMRLTADGRLKPCLANNLEIDLHDENGNIHDKNILREKFKEAILNKPGSHHFYEDEELYSGRNMSQIGG